MHDDRFDEICSKLSSLSSADSSCLSDSDKNIVYEVLINNYIITLPEQQRLIVLLEIKQRLNHYIGINNFLQRLLRDTNDT